MEIFRWSSNSWHNACSRCQVCTLQKTKHKISRKACLKVKSSMHHTIFFFDKYTLLMKFSVVLIKLCTHSIKKYKIINEKLPTENILYKYLYLRQLQLFSHTLKTASETFIKPHLYSHLQFFSCANTIKMCTVFKRKQHITDTSLSYNFMPSLIKSTAMYVIWMLCFLPIHKNSSFELNEDEDILCMPGHWEKRLPTMIFQELCATTANMRTKL